MVILPLGIHLYFLLVILLPDFFIAIHLFKKLNFFLNGNLNEAMGERIKNKSLYIKCKYVVEKSIKKYKRRDQIQNYYVKAEERMKKSGYHGQYAAVVYIITKYVITAILFIITIAIYFPSLREAIILSAANIIIIETVINKGKKEVNMKLQKYIYKIYKYLHNQISSGVKVTDAIRTVYEVIEDKNLRKVLIKLAARYELTLDIDASLNEFKSNYDIQEAETLCVALKQGVITGDNKELLERQEDIMFKKYFNYIQAETDSCRIRATITTGVFAAVIVIMITVPLVNDVYEAVGKIFIN